MKSSRPRKAGTASGTQKAKAAQANLAEEPTTAYGIPAFTSIGAIRGRALVQRPHSSNNKTLLTHKKNKPESQMTAFEKMDMVRLGINKKELEKLKNTTALDYDNLAKALSVTRATLINKKGDEKFNTALSERIVSLAAIYSYGYEVFEDEARFNAWMFSPNQALGGQLPFNLIDNQFGREEIKNMIGRIDYGVYA